MRHLATVLALCLTASPLAADPPLIWSGGAICFWEEPWGGDVHQGDVLGGLVALSHHSPDAVVMTRGFWLEGWREPTVFYADQMDFLGANVWNEELVPEKWWATPFNGQILVAYAYLEVWDWKLDEVEGVWVWSCFDYLAWSMFMYQP